MGLEAIVSSPFSYPLGATGAKAGHWGDGANLSCDPQSPEITGGPGPARRSVYGKVLRGETWLGRIFSVHPTRFVCTPAAVSAIVEVALPIKWRCGAGSDQREGAGLPLGLIQDSGRVVIACPTGGAAGFDALVPGAGRQPVTAEGGESCRPERGHFTRVSRAASRWQFHASLGRTSLCGTGHGRT